MTMTPDEIRADMASRQKQLDALAATQKERAQELAEALCPFKVGDKVEYSEFTSTAVGIVTEVHRPGVYGSDGEGRSWTIAIKVVEPSGAATGTFIVRDYQKQYLRKLAPEPAPDPEVEAVADVVHDVLSECFKRLASRGLGSYEENCSAFARRIIAALDAVRACRRAKALQTVCGNRGFHMPTELAIKALAAADAAEARDG